MSLFHLGEASLVRLGEIVMILELHRQGVGVSAIARRLELDRKTVRRYIAQGLEPPAYGPRQPSHALNSSHGNPIRPKLTLGCQFSPFLYLVATPMP
jgi:transposase